MKYTIYDSTSGMINGIVDIGDSTDVSHLILLNYIEGEYNGNTYYIQDGTAVVRPLLTDIINIDSTSVPIYDGTSFIGYDSTAVIADGTSLIIISGLPNCVVTIIYRTRPDFIPVFNDFVTDGDIQFSALYPGKYTVFIECFPYQQYVIDLEAL
jgi:hypothetical protein